MATGAYTDQQKVEHYLKRSLSSHEAAIVDTLVDAATEWIDTELDTTFANVSTTSTRYYDGDGSQWLDIQPAKGDFTVDFLDGYGNLLQTLESTDFAAWPNNKTIKNSLRLRALRFPRGVQNIRVVAKFTSYDDKIPPAIVLAATMLVAEYLDGNENVIAESIEGWSVKYGEVPDITAKVSDLIAGYRRLAL